MNLTGRFSKRMVVVALAVLIVAGLGAFLVFRKSPRENTTPDHSAHAKATPAPVAATAATNGATGEKTASRKIKSYRSTMMPGEVSQTPRKDSMGWT